MKVSIKIAVLLFWFLPFYNISAQNNGYKYTFIENKGQWSQPYLYTCKIPSGNLYFEKNKLVYGFLDAAKMKKVATAMHDRTQVEFNAIPGFAVHVNFLDASPYVQLSDSNNAKYYCNYYFGSNPQQWVSKLYPAYNLTYQNIYNNINIDFYTDKNHLKYNFVVLPGGNPKDIRLQYEGQLWLKIVEGQLEIGTPFQVWKEAQPYAYQIIEGRKKRVFCRYRLKNDVVSFKVGKYNPKYALIIDPTLIFSTYSGSGADNFGFTATYDYQGNTYGGGNIYFGQSYSFPGAFSSTFSAGAYDVMIQKYNTTGTQLLYYTYLGGTEGEVPFSLVADKNNNLYVLGVTGSADFPVDANAYDNSFNGGDYANVLNPFPDPTEYQHGSDLFIAKFSADGTILMGSTFLGGTENDGLNKGITHNYGDFFRGEIIVDNQGDCYITSNTISTDFPIQNGFQATLAGKQDAVVAKLNNNLTQLLWSSYFGGSEDDAAYSIQLNNAGQLYMTGGTKSANLAISPTALKQNYADSIDGFIAKISGNGSTLLSATYLGTSAYDQCFIIQLDQSQNVYVIGQTEGNYPVKAGPSANIYSNANGGQFIQKLSPNLSTSIISTVFGSGNNMINIVPTAFLVDECNYIYVSGWGGATNSQYGGGNTFNMPITSDAYQSQTDGSDFYLIVLDTNATALRYATYFGGNLSHEHVDGGTSRFDKKGIVYQSVCASCGGFQDFPTTPGAWSATNGSFNCNLAVFKFDISEFSAIIDIKGPTAICTGDSVVLENISVGGDSFTWNLGDGTNAYTTKVTHTYNQSGTYQVMLIVQGKNSCLPSDTAFLTINVEDFPINARPDTTICPGTPVTLIAEGGESYTWQPAAGLSSPNNDTTLAHPKQSTNYIVTVVSAIGCVKKDTAHVILHPPAIIDAGKNRLIDFGDTVVLTATGGTGSFVWTPDSFLTCNVCQITVSAPKKSIQYFVELTDKYGCKYKDSVFIYIKGTIFVPNTFTPNRDGLNDLFTAFGEELKTFHMLIFNRWGELLYETNDIQTGWNGYYKGKKCQLGCYVWKITYEELSGRTGSLYGHVNLLR